MKSGFIVKNTWLLLLPEGKRLFLDISDIINKRYGTTSTKI
jgi:hypothetical protein